MLKCLKSKRRILLILLDTLVFIAAYLFVWCLDSILSGERVNIISYLFSLGLHYGVTMPLRLCMRVYRNVWRYANSGAYLDIVFADLSGGVLSALVGGIIGGPVYIGYLSYAAAVGIIMSATLSSRFVYQQIHKKPARDAGRERDRRITVAIVGAGRVGALLAEELLCYKNSHYKPVLFVDRNRDKVGSRVAGLPVYGEDDSTFERLASYPVQEIIIAIPHLSSEEAKELFSYYGRAGCKIKLYDFPAKEDSGAAAVSSRRVIREFKIEDLLFRDAIKVADRATADFYRGRTVLVTGGGGSIGSELSRQIAACKPKMLVIFDIYENNAYDLQQELMIKYGDSLPLAVEIGSVRDRARLDAVFAYYRPDVVFHAAAHKHVPLMEHSNCEAVKNNVIGTYNTANAAEKYGVSRFILISTDKAVNPTNVMGASKRLCEMVIQCRADSNTAFSAVRFGNVLGSNGSVIPLFKRQIAKGGPITVTDRRIIRYFMTIPEASGLVMQAGAMAERGELFVLDMGKPVHIYDLAENMIRLSGLIPHEDVRIVETGLRPGEKLYEELLINTNDLKKTENNLIFVERCEPISREAVEEKLSYLSEVLKREEGVVGSKAIVSAMKEAVPEFRSPEEVNLLADSSGEMRAAGACR